MNKTILGLIAAVIVLGAALVLFNNAQKPEAVQNPKTELPALPDLAAERAAKSANLKEVPALPEAVENTASVRAPIVAPNTAQNTAPKTAPDNVQGTGEVAKPPVLAAANTAAADKLAARTESTAREQASESHAVARGAVAPRPEAKSEAAKPAATVAEAKSDAAKSAQAETKAQAKTETARQAQAETKSEPAKSAQAETKAQAKTETARQARPAKAEAPQDKTSADREAAEKSAAREEQKQAKPKIVVLVRDKGATVRLNLGSTISYRQMLLENPDRVVIDVTGSYKDLKAPGIPDNPLVTNVRLGHYDNRTRIVVDLKAKPSSCRVILSEDRDRLDIRVDR